MTAARSDKPSHGASPPTDTRKPSTPVTGSLATAHVLSRAWLDRWPAFMRREGIDNTCEEFYAERRMRATEMLSKVGGGKCAQDWRRIASWDAWLPQPDATGACVRQLSHRALQDPEGVWQDPIEQGVHLSVASELVVCCRDFEDYQPSSGTRRGYPEGQSRALVKNCKEPHYFVVLETESAGMPTLGEAMSKYQLSCTSADDGSTASTVRSGAGVDYDSEGPLVRECDLGGYEADEFGWQSRDGYGGYDDCEISY